MKKEFKEAGHIEENENDSDDSFLVKKDNKKEEEANENVEELKLEEILKKKNKKKDMALITDKDLLQRFYGDDSKLD